MIKSIQNLDPRKVSHKGDMNINILRKMQLFSKYIGLDINTSTRSAKFHNELKQ